MLSISLGINILNYFLDVNNYIFALQDNLLTSVFWRGYRFLRLSILSGFSDDAHFFNISQGNWEHLPQCSCFF